MRWKRVTVFVTLLSFGETMAKQGGIGGFHSGYDGHHHPNHHPHQHPYHNHPKPYEFGYRVVDSYTGNDFGHSESSDGGVVKGNYFVLLPDGRRQVVTYTADHLHGFQAKVSYEGTAHFPQKPFRGYGHH